MNIIHIRADGTVQESIEGVVIENDQFYQIAERILKHEKSD